MPFISLNSYRFSPSLHFVFILVRISQSRIVWNSVIPLSPRVLNSIDYLKGAGAEMWIAGKQTGCRGFFCFFFLLCVDGRSSKWLVGGEKLWCVAPTLRKQHLYLEQCHLKMSQPSWNFNHKLIKLPARCYVHCCQPICHMSERLCVNTGRCAQTLVDNGHPWEVIWMPLLLLTSC